MRHLPRTFVAAAFLLAAAAPASVSYADDLNSVLQQTIQHSNDEQVQAIATSNVTLISDTVTGDYAQQLTGTLQTMLKNHVTSISLTTIQWGPVSIAPDSMSATVTSYETWHLVSRDGGPVDFEPARNDYSMVLDNGSWKIASDIQTVGAPTPSATNTPTATPTPSPTATPTDVPTATPTATPVPSTDLAPSQPDQPSTDMVPDQPDQPDQSATAGSE